MDGRFINLIGQKFGRLVVIERAENDRRRKAMWVCECECGNTIKVRGNNLRDGGTKSCGCLKKEHLIAYHFKHGKTKSSEFSTWQNMIQRCENKKNISYRNYGGRGIKVSLEWHSFERFYQDMGDQPFKTSLDRIDVNGDYCKENCRWATKKEQMNNKRTNKIITYNGKTQTLQEWCDELMINRSTLYNRLYTLGWSVNNAFTTPFRRKKVI